MTDYSEAQLRWRLRPISGGDLDWAFALHRDALGEYVREIWGWEDDSQRRMYFERFSPRRQVIEVDGQRVGVIEVEERQDELYLRLLELTPSWQGKGLDAGIMRWLTARADELDRPLTLHVLRSNPRARAFYQRHGLSVVETEPFSFVMRSGT